MPHVGQAETRHAVRSKTLYWSLRECRREGPSWCKRGEDVSIVGLRAAACKSQSNDVYRPPLRTTPRRGPEPTPLKKSGGISMSEPLYYEGLTIEFDSAERRLTIEGQRVPIQVTDGLFTSKDLPAVSATTLLQLARKIVDQSPELPRRRCWRQRHEETLKHEGVNGWNRWRRANPEVRPILYGVNLSREALPSGLRQANLANAVLIGADLTLQNLTEANFHEANLGNAILRGANLTDANFCRTDLYKTDLTGAILFGANLQGTQLSKTKFGGAQLVDCTLYGLSAWDLELDATTIQKDLKIFYTPKTVREPQGRDTQHQFNAHDVRVAQFIYLLLDNARIHDVIDTTTAKVVLILGRFESSDYKATLDAIWNELHRHGYAPMLFDFEKPHHMGLMETVMTLAGISRFIIADITSAHTVREELSAIVRNYPHKPVQPILRDTAEEYPTFPDLKSFSSLLPLHRYTDIEGLVKSLYDTVIEPAERWIAMTVGGQALWTGSAHQRLERENEQLKRRVAELEKVHASGV